jgi:hypothetical protein
MFEESCGSFESNPAFVLHLRSQTKAYQQNHCLDGTACWFDCAPWDSIRCSGQEFRSKQQQLTASLAGLHRGVTAQMQDSLDAFVPPQVKHKQTPAGREAAAVQRRRDAEAARQERIFNVKQRTIGVSTRSAWHIQCSCHVFERAKGLCAPAYPETSPPVPRCVPPSTLRARRSTRIPSRSKSMPRRRPRRWKSLARPCSVTARAHIDPPPPLPASPCPLIGPPRCQSPRMAAHAL